MLVLILAVLIGLIPAAIASSKGHNFFLWWLFGAAIWIVALPCALFVQRPGGSPYRAHRVTRGPPGLTWSEPEPRELPDLPEPDG